MTDEFGESLTDSETWAETTDSSFQRRQAVLDAVPSNWLDPILTGPHAVVGMPPYGCSDIERLMNAIRERLSKAMDDNP